MSSANICELGTGFGSGYSMLFMELRSSTEMLYNSPDHEHPCGVPVVIGTGMVLCSLTISCVVRWCMVRKYKRRMK